MANEHPKKDESQWLVTAPEGQSFTSALTIACKGNANLANLLQYFLHEAAKEAKRKGIDKDKAEYIEMNKKLDYILEGLKNYNRGASKKTIIDRIGKLQSLGYLQSEKYSQAYRVYFPKVIKAFTNPPKPDTPKLRGIHARRAKEGCNLGNPETTTLTPETTTLSEKSVVSGEDIENLNSKVESLQSNVEKLHCLVENLHSELAHERACREDLEAKLASLYSNDIDTNIVTNIESNAPVQTFPQETQQTPTNISLTEQQPLLDTPLVEPSMNGKWDTEQVVQYTEFRNGKRYNPKMREAQLSAAKWLHTQDKALTSEQYKQAFDERFDPWWVEHKKKLDVTDMKAKEQSSGVIRLYAMLSKIEANKNRPNLRVVSSQPKPVDMPPPPKTREQLRAEKC